MLPPNIETGLGLPVRPVVCRTRWSGIASSSWSEQPEALSNESSKLSSDMLQLVRHKTITPYPPPSFTDTVVLPIFLDAGRTSDCLEFFVAFFITILESV